MISCQKHKSNNLNFKYIYRISYKIAKKANPQKKICPIEKTISQQFFIDMILVFYSRNQKVGSGCDIVLWYHRKIMPRIYYIIGIYYHCVLWHLPLMQTSASPHSESSTQPLSSFVTSSSDFSTGIFASIPYLICFASLLFTLTVA